ncbi:MAG: hypothetical protein ACO1NQ_02355 [Flavobacteriales bacterium]
MGKAVRLFLDLDGVLADFDGGVRKLLGTTPQRFQERYGAAAFWKRLANAPDHYGRLDPLPDAERLVEGVRHLSPTVLTGLPLGKWAEPQKRAWMARHFPDIDVITTMARDKHRYCSPGDILVDDQERYRDRWEAAGGRFIHHTSAERTLAAIHDLGL